MDDSPQKSIFTARSTIRVYIPCSLSPPDCGCPSSRPLKLSLLVSSARAQAKREMRSTLALLCIVLCAHLVVADPASRGLAQAVARVARHRNMVVAHDAHPEERSDWYVPCRSGRAKCVNSHRPGKWRPYHQAASRGQNIVGLKEAGVPLRAGTRRSVRLGNGIDERVGASDIFLQDASQIHYEFEQICHTVDVFD